MSAGKIFIVIGAACLAASPGLAQSVKPLRREANVTLRLPQNAPAYGFATERAFGGMKFTDPVAIAAPPGETNRLFIVEQRGRIVVLTNLLNPTRTVFLDLKQAHYGSSKWPLTYF